MPSTDIASMLGLYKRRLTLKLKEEETKFATLKAAVKAADMEKQSSLIRACSTLFKNMMDKLILGLKDVIGEDLWNSLVGRLRKQQLVANPSVKVEFIKLPEILLEARRFTTPEVWDRIKVLLTQFKEQGS